MNERGYDDIIFDIEYDDTLTDWTGMVVQHGPHTLVVTLPIKDRPGLWHTRHYFPEAPGPDIKAFFIKEAYIKQLCAALADYDKQVKFHRDNAVRLMKEQQKQK